jgi:hypothetical protein
MAERSAVLPPIPRKSIPLVPIDPFREAGKHPGSFLVLSQFILPRLILVQGAPYRINKVTGKIGDVSIESS